MLLNQWNKLIDLQLVCRQILYRNAKAVYYFTMLSASILGILLFVRIYNAVAAENDYLNYLGNRRKIISEEESMLFGAKIVLSEEEQRANDILMKYKTEELQNGFKNPKSFLPSKNFLHVSKEIADSKVFRAIRRMPKAGVLHVHVSAINSRDFILRNITRRPHLYVCRAGAGQLGGSEGQEGDALLKLHFFDERTARERLDCSWQLLAKARELDELIDAEIAEALTMYSERDRHRDDDASKNIDETWKKFLSIFEFIKSLVTYRPVYEDFLYHVMEELYEDNVQFVEVRTPFSSLYELDGSQYKDLQVVKIYKKVVDRFISEHPDFVGVKWIYSIQRNVPNTTFTKYVEKFRIFKAAYPNHVVGFDLIGQEDKGRPLKDFAKQLWALSSETQFFFHAGESNWNGQDTDENLLDAILLNTKRIGHGYALIKHPKLLQLVKEKNIGLEINPISNQVLKLVDDLRNHPASFFFTQDLPIVVSNDDPGFWGAKALSYDFYETFVGIMSSKADLRALKQLALNSITYSSLNETEKQSVLCIWQKRWRKFISEIANDK